MTEDKSQHSFEIHIRKIYTPETNNETHPISLINHLYETDKSTIFNVSVSSTSGNSKDNQIFFYFSGIRVDKSTMTAY